MFTVSYRFLAGRYHATPWGAHVNEGLVEWPPSPFRLLRALIATGFSRLGWTAVEGAARELVDVLTAAAPSYALPRGTTSHTRHYMPPFKGNTTKVLDAFLRFSDGDEMLVRYPTELPAACRGVLAELLRVQPYLGRAESWVEARLLADVPTGVVWLIPEDRPPGPGFERVELLAPDQPADYTEWRRRAVATAIERREREERAKAASKGKEFKALSKRETSKIEEAIPVDMVAVLMQDTATLRREGWSQPPGTRWLSYFRERDALVPRIYATRPMEKDEQPTAALFALTSDTANDEVLPLMSDALRRLEVLHDELIRSSSTAAGPSPCFTGKVEGERTSGHRHASLIPLTLGRRPERLDHVLVYCPMGFDERARDALFGVRGHRARKGHPDLFVALAGLGSIESFRQTIPLLLRASRFCSVTPFVPSRYLKAKGHDALLGQVQRELAHRRLPAAAAVEVEMDDGRWASAEQVIAGTRGNELGAVVEDRWLRPSRRFRGFNRARWDKPPPVAIGLSLRLSFEAPLEGPISLGYASHFGLGLFAPEATSR